MTSIYQKIINNLTQAIDQKKLKKGDKIPSVRQLSKDYACSKDTVQKALLELKYQRYIYAVPKSGYYVLGKVSENQEDQLSLEDYHNFAYSDFKLCLNETMTNNDNYLFNYYKQVEGLADLRDALEQHLNQQSVYCKAKDIIITSGTQQALYILSQLHFKENKEVILLEKPTYSRMEKMVKDLGVPFQTIQRTFQGLDLEQLESIFKKGKIKFFYTIPRFSSPLGLSYNNAEKKAIIDLAEKYDVYIIEDDFMGDFAASKQVPIHYFDTHQRVIYLKSFSMSLFPSLRIGALVIPKTLKDLFLKHKSMIDLDTNLIMQKALSLYLTNGMFARNFRHLRNYFQEKMDQIEDYLNEKYPELAFRISPQFLILAFSSQIPKIKSLSSRDYEYLPLNDQTYIKLNLLKVRPDVIDSLISDLLPATETRK